MKVALVAHNYSSFSLSSSYKRSLDFLKIESKAFFVSEYLSKYLKFGRIGRTLYNHIKIDTWERQANRDLAIDLNRFKPDIIIIMGKTQILPGTISFLKSIYKIKVVMIWMDTLCNLNEDTLRLAQLTDCCASYSFSAEPVFKKLGFRDTMWLPLAGDKKLHGIFTLPKEYKYDITFIGGWRPEREAALLSIINNFPNLKINILGYYWDKSENYKVLKPFVINQIITGKAYAEFLNLSRINLNIIDDTNYPSANMRFFEIPIANGLQLSSYCPEQKEIFRDGKEILYFKNEKEMIEKIEWVIDNENLASSIRRNSHKLAIESQTYDHRLKELIKYIHEN